MSERSLNDKTACLLIAPNRRILWHSFSVVLANNVAIRFLSLYDTICDKIFVPFIEICHSGLCLFLLSFSHKITLSGVFVLDKCE
jgi:hypothetical protein